MKFILALLMCLLCIIPVSAQGHRKFTDAEICLAVLVQELGWSEDPTGGMSKIGKFYRAREKYMYLQVVHRKISCQN